ncbi:HesA/MoeB/ThiF family protein [Thalassotalea psychrophila]|uniref:HesA/MoeB/ThiF family protein n=1 Tax=Thalassotalea psychrophila TaxID=3065647 RepID=A0ABY9TS78_9GAMM|nr:HesA/MoeB/ThiF family protein [Colwelliaceae bacterium SQ149]
MALNNKENQRYSRHLLTQNIGEQGQLKLKQASILIVGVGGLGCAASQYLAASGVGKITLVDHDKIELSNLQRQILFKTNHLNKNKVEVAQNQLSGSNPMIEVIAINRSILTFSEEQFNPYELVLDCTDNFTARQFINECCLKAKVPVLSASAIDGEGQLIFFDFSTPDSPCYKCVFPGKLQSSVNCSTSGVLSPLLGVIGSMQASQAIKILIGMNVTAGQLTSVNLWDFSFRQFTVHKQVECKTCSVIN